MKILIWVVFFTSYNAVHGAPLLQARGGDGINGKYLVKLKDETNVDFFVSKMRGFNMAAFRSGQARIMSRQYDVVQGFEAALDHQSLNTVRSFPEVEYVQVLNKAQLGGTTPMWNLDRIDQDTLPLDRNYNVVETGQGVNAYVIDTGINPEHFDFEDRASVMFDAYGGDGLDCDGHGTHVAGTIGGSVFGVAKRVNLFSLKVFSGCTTITDESKIISAFEYLVTRVQRPAVVSMSVYIRGGSAYFDTVVSNFIAKTGVTVVVCAGNDDTVSCNDSPGRVPEVLTVGAVDENDTRWTFSNYGSCTDIYAPGVDVSSASSAGSYKVVTLSGTSTACPHVAGAVALLLETSPDLSPRATHQMILDNATVGVVTDPKGANLLLRV